MSSEKYTRVPRFTDCRLDELLGRWTCIAES